jgi:non-heme chloroperoxidase
MSMMNACVRSAMPSVGLGSQAASHDGSRSSSSGSEAHEVARVFALDPVTPLGMAFNAEQTDLFRMMMTSRELTRAVMATAAASLFVPESLAPNTMPRFREGLGELQVFYERILEQTFGVSEGVWLGTPFNFNLERESGDLERRMAEIWHPHLVLWGEKDGWIAPADLKTMAAAMPDCRLITVPGIGHSMNLESPALYAGYLAHGSAGFLEAKWRSSSA